MSLMYKLIEEGRNKDREKIAQDLLESGVRLQKVKEITGLSEEEIKRIENSQFQLMK